MLFSDKYKEIKSSVTGIHKQKGSKFISYAFPVYSEEQAKEKIRLIKRKEPSANHYCFAYVLHPDKSLKKVNDDGEPNSTAGKPILNHILKKDLTNIIIIVVRYFGGTKLGIPGLIKAYKNAAEKAISETIINLKTIKDYYKIEFKYEQTNNIIQIIKRHNLEIIEQIFKINCSVVVAIEKNKTNIVLKDLQNNKKFKVVYIKTI